MEELVLNEGDLLYLRILKEGSLAPVAQLWSKEKRYENRSTETRSRPVID